MNCRHARFLVLFIALIALLAISAAPAFAGSASVSGTLTPGGATMPVIFISSPNCTGQGVSAVLYATHTLTVDTAGVYSINLPDDAAGAFSLYLHSAGFNPAAGFPTCLAADNSGAIGFSFALAANTTYYVVPFDDTFAQLGGSYTLTISGPGNVSLDGVGASGAASIDDGRLNRFDLAAPFAIYCAADSLEIYAINGAGQGTLVLTTGAGAVEATDASAANAVMVEGSGIRVFKLTSGELQAVSAPDFEGKVYNVVFSAFPCLLKETFLN